MISTGRTSFFGEDPTADPDDRHSGKRFRCGTSEGSRVWCNTTDVSGIIMVVFALATLAYAEYVVVWVILFTDSLMIENMVLYSLLTLMAVWAHLKTMLTDPGTVPRGAIPLEGEENAETSRHTLCGRCESYKPTRAHHCSLCARCVVRMDHHCPWMNNCIGVGNHKYFFLFLFYAFALSGYVIGLTIFHFLECLVKHHCDDYGVLMAYMIRAALVLACAAMIFTLSMVINQFKGIRTGMGTVERLQRQRKDGRMRGSPSDYAPVELEDIFGDGNKLLWLVPTKPYFRHLRRKRLWGFRDPHASRARDSEDV